MIGELALVWFSLARVRRELRRDGRVLRTLVWTVKGIRADMAEFQAQPDRQTPAPSPPPPSVPTLTTPTPPVPLQRSAAVEEQPPIPNSPRRDQRPKRTAESGDTRDEICLNSLRTEGARTESIPVGKLRGRWVDRKEFLVELVAIKGKLSRRQVNDIAQRLRISEQLSRALTACRNDDPIVLDLYCDLKSFSKRISTPIIGPAQELNRSLIPEVDLDIPRLSIKVDEDASPLLVTIAWH